MLKLIEIGFVDTYKMYNKYCWQNVTNLISPKTKMYYFFPFLIYIYIKFKQIQNIMFTF